MSKNQDLGIYNKFNVTRTDGMDFPGGKHDGCEYFVLDLTHDPFAQAAIVAYAEACEAEYPALARDLMTKAVNAQLFGQAKDPQ